MRLLPLLLGISALSFAQNWPPPGMDCQKKTIVVLKAGPNVANLKDHYAEHIKVVADLMKKGMILAAGPIEGGPLEGIDIYHSTDLKEVESMVKQDPFVVNEVLTIAKIAPWQRCTAAKQ